MRGLGVALAVLTRIPVAAGAADPADLARSVTWFPVVGALVGGTVGGVFALVSLRVPAAPAAVLAVAAGIALTGALHEDGLADTCDGLGGRTPAGRLAAMADPRLGTFGALALAVSLLVRVGVLAALDPGSAVPLLAAAHALARGTAAAALAVPARARPEGLAAGFRVDPWRGALAAAVAIVAAVGLLGAAALPLVLGAVIPGGLVARGAARRLGGMTGDVLGACEQAAEVGAFVAASAIMGR